MDVDTLHEDICKALAEDSLASSILSQSPLPPRCSADNLGLLILNNRIYVPNISNLQLCILHYKHDHLLAGHYGFNKTLELI